MDVDRYRVCELYAPSPAGGSGSGYRLGDRLVLTARHVIAPAPTGAGGQVTVRPLGTKRWLPARVEWQDADADAALIWIDDEGWHAPAEESVLRWGKLAGSNPAPCAAVGFPWASARPDKMRDTAHVYGQLAPLGQLRQGRLDLDVESAAPSLRAGGSAWAGMSGAGVIVDGYLVGVITVDPARYQNRLVAVPTGQLLDNPDFRALLTGRGVPTEAAPLGADWYLQLPGELTVSLEPAYQPISRRDEPTPSMLLRPEHRLVPFLGRQTELDQITGWCQDPATKRPVLLVTGGGGSGKTRLGREACIQMLRDGWDAGFANDQRRDGKARTRLKRRTLLVVDEADLHTGLISALVGYLRWDDAGPPVRLLLLARAAGAWWDRLVRQQELADSYTVLDLDRHPVPLTDRSEHFRRASIAFAAYGGPGAQPADLPPAAELDDPAYAEPLLIHIAALLRAVETSATPPPGPGEGVLDTDITPGQPGVSVRKRLLRALCERERGRWYQLGKQSHLSFNPDLPLVDQVVALATLTAAADQASATSLLAALPNQAEVTRIGADALAAWARRLYSGPGYWNALRPDLLAEQHLADTAQLPRIAATAVRLAAGQHWEAGLLTQLLSELTRGAPNQPAVQAALDKLLAGALPRIVHLAVSTADAELADLASLALQLAPQPGLAAPLADQMPRHSVQLAALAATLTSQQVIQARAGTTSGRPDAAHHLAESLNKLSLRLGDLGRPEDALAAIEEATSIHRELAAAGPYWYATRRRRSQRTLRLDLATSLINLSTNLIYLGRREDALAASGEAVTICRELARASPGSRISLANSLNSLSTNLSDLGRREDALAAGEEASGIFRELAARWPDICRPGLAGSLGNLATQLGKLGRAEDALAAAEEASGIYRELAARWPDAYRPDLARSCNNLSLLLNDLGRREDALAAAEEASGINRELAAARPDAYRPGLAASLVNLSSYLGELGRAEDALAAGEEASGIFRELAAARPDAYRPDLARSCNSLSVLLGELGRAEDALAAGEEASGINRELAAARPDAYRPDLARSCNSLSVLLGELGRAEDALAAGEEASGIFRELAAARPDAFRPDLADSLHSLSVLLGELGRAEDALAAGEEASGIYRELAARWPDKFRPGLADSLHSLSVLLGELGRAEDALAAGEEASGIYRELAARWPDAYRPGLARALNYLSVLLGELGRAEDALAAGEEAVAIRRELAAARPDAFRPCLAASLVNLSSYLGELGRREDALAAVEEAVAIRRELAARWPDAYRGKLEQSLRLVAWLEHGEDLSLATQPAGAYAVITVRYHFLRSSSSCRSPERQSAVTGAPR